MRVHVEHRFVRTTLDHFIEAYFSPGLNEAVAPLASLKKRTLIEENVLADGKIERRVEMLPEVKLPRPVARLVQSAPIQYVERSLYDPVARSATYEIESAAGEVVKVWGLISFLAGRTPDEVVRRIDGQVEVKLPGLGGLIERIIAREVRGRYDKIQAFTQRWLDEHPASESAAG